MTSQPQTEHITLVITPADHLSIVSPINNMQPILLLLYLPYLTLGHWRCQDGSKANCDQACTDAANPEIPAADVPETEEPTTVLPSTEFDDPVEAQKY